MPEASWLDLLAIDLDFFVLPEAEILENLHSFTVARESNSLIGVVLNLTFQGVRGRATATARGKCLHVAKLLDMNILEFFKGIDQADLPIRERHRLVFVFSNKTFDVEGQHVVKRRLRMLRQNAAI